ncbi:MAG: hypothetical protein ACYDA9_09500 [Terriglobia bacterium]
MMTRKFWLATLVIVVTSSAELADAQKQVKSDPRDARTALGCVRTINTASAVYKSTYDNSYSPTLAAMGINPTSTSPTAEAARFIDNNLSGGKKAGYVFTYKSGAKDKFGHITSYTVTARPQKWQKGVVSFFTDQTGVIRWTKDDRAPTAKDPTIDSLLK